MKIFFTVLLALPLIALYQLGVDWRWTTGYGLALNLITYLTYMWDKRQARNDGWRVAEFRLHMLEILGGWPAAWVAQQRLRHKNAKRRYQVVFWLIVLAYQLLALDIVFKGMLYQYIAG